MKTYREFVEDIIQEQSHRFSSTQINLPKKNANEILAWGAKFVADEDVYERDGEYGREDEIHVTVLYGLHANSPDELIELLKDEKPIKYTLKEISLFESDFFEVLKFTVESSDLKRIHQKIRDNCKSTSTFPEYHPHCTIAYLKKGTGKKYCGKNPFLGTALIADEILFSNRERKKTKIVLKEK